MQGEFLHEEILQLRFRSPCIATALDGCIKAGAKDFVLERQIGQKIIVWFDPSRRIERLCTYCEGLLRSVIGGVGEGHGN